MISWKSKWHVSLQSAHYIRLLMFSVYLRLDIYLLRFYCKAAKFTFNYFHTCLISDFKTIVTRSEFY